jgi:hypothetical protein
VTMAISASEAASFAKAAGSRSLMCPESLCLKRSLFWLAMKSRLGEFMSYLLLPPIVVLSMPNRLWIAAVIAVAPILAMSPIAFPANHEAGCVRAAQGARRDQRAFMSLMKSHDRDDVQKLVNYRLGRVRANDVKLVTDDNVCQRAANAYSSVLRSPKPGRRVTLLKVGDRYVASDPNFKPDKHRRAVTFDSTFTEPLALVVQ